MSGNRVGTGMMSGYNNLLQGRSTVRAAKEMMRLGIIDPRMVEYDKIGQVKRIKPGALKGSDEYGSNPYQWMKDVLVPAMGAKGITSESGILNEMGAIFGNRTGSNLFSLMYLQQDKIAKNMRISQNAMSTPELIRLAQKTPQGAEMALAKSWENLKIAAGESLVPIIIPAINALAAGLRALGESIARHPVRFEVLVYGFAALSSALAFSGTVLLLKAAFMGINIIIPTLTTSILTGVIPALAGVTAVLGPLAAIAATIAAVYYHKEIAAKIDEAAPGIGDWLYSRDFSLTSMWGIPPSSNNKDTTIHTVVNLDGKKVGAGIAKANGGPSNSGSGFDSRQSLPSGYNPFAP
jgi:hypothetical protein